MIEQHPYFTRRREIVPQMWDHDKYAGSPQYLPYLMYFQQANIDNKTFKTDEFGFRHTIMKDGKSLLDLKKYNELLDKGEGAALLGASVAFSYGAVGDENSISSLLNRKTDLNWFNFFRMWFQFNTGGYSFLPPGTFQD